MRRTTEELEERMDRFMLAFMPWMMGALLIAMLLGLAWLIGIGVCALAGY